MAATITIHHLYRNPDDLLPACGVVPGPGDPEIEGSDTWHTGHVARVLLAHAAVGQGCCTLCLAMAREQIPSSDSWG